MIAFRELKAGSQTGGNEVNTHKPSPRRSSRAYFVCSTVAYRA